MDILGINCFSHDTAACLLRDGAIAAFAEEERFNREQHTKAFPDAAAAYCLADAGISINDVEVVVFAHQTLRDYARGAGDALRRGAPKRLAAQTYVDLGLYAKERGFRRRFGYRGRVMHVGHH